MSGIQRFLEQHVGDVDDALELAGVGLDLIDDALGSDSDVVDVATAVLAGARAVIAIFRAGRDGALTPAECREALANLTTRLAANDAAADAAVDRKFPRGGDD